MRPSELGIYCSMSLREGFALVLKRTFLWGFFCGFGSMHLGGLLAEIIWPASNLGPPVGMLYGLFWGTSGGVILGFALGLMGLFQKVHCEG